jgi:hypothetical protein
MTGQQTNTIRIAQIQARLGPTPPMLRRADMAFLLEEIERLNMVQIQLAGCLMGMVCQHCQADEDGVYETFALSANEDSLQLLEDNGLAERLPGHLLRYRLLWDNLLAVLVEE